jgi:uncharacterized UPF0146 family protein
MKKEGGKAEGENGIMECKLVIFDFRLRLYTAIAEIYSFRSRQSLGANLYSYITATRLEGGIEEEVGGSGKR